MCSTSAENGAGKKHPGQGSERRICGDEGEILVDGKKVKINSPQDSRNLGIRFIYQELRPGVPIWHIARNIFLGMEPMRLGTVDGKELYSRAGQLLEKFHIELDPAEKVRRLSVTQQKMVEIARALTTSAKVIVLDEPTDVLEDRISEGPLSSCSPSEARTKCRLCLIFPIVMLRCLKLGDRSHRFARWLGCRHV